MAYLKQPMNNKRHTMSEQYHNLYHLGVPASVYSIISRWRRWQFGHQMSVICRNNEGNICSLAYVRLTILLAALTVARSDGKYHTNTNTVKESCEKHQYQIYFIKNLFSSK